MKTRFVLPLLLALSGLTLSPAGANGLMEVYEQAKTYDAELKAAEFDYLAAREALPLSRSSLRPQASLEYVPQYTDFNSDLSPNYFSQGLTLRLTQTVFNYANMLAVDQAKLAVNQAEANYEAQRQDLMVRVSTAYFNVLRAQAVLVFRRSELEAIGRQKEQNERRFEVGLVPVTDVKDAQAQFDLATAQEIAAANSLSAAKEELIVISGADPDNLKELREDVALAQPAPSDINEWVKLAKDQNIPLVIAKLNAEIANKQVKADRAARYPTVDLELFGNINETDRRNAEETESGQVRLRLNLPLLTGGRNNATIRQSRMESLSANSQLTAQRRATVQITRNSFRAVLADISRANALQQALISTQKSLEAQEAGFNEGLLTSLEVLRSLRDTFQAQSDYSSARYDYIVNSLNLKQAAGILNENDLREIDSWLKAATP